MLRRWGPRVAGGLVLVLALLFFLRWPLLEGRVRRELARLVADGVQGDLRDVRLSGSLLFSVTAEDLRIDGRGAAREIRARRVVARYGFLGLGRLRLEVEGGFVLFAEDPSTPPAGAKIVPDAEVLVRTFRFPGRIRVRDGTLVLPDGRRLEILEAVLDGEDARVRGRLPGFGDLEARVRRPADGLAVEATASEGMLRRVRLDRRGEAFDYALELEGRVIEGNGRVVYGPGGRLRSAEAAFRGKDGSGRAALDFENGRVDATVDVAFDLQEPVRARVAARGSLAGPLLGPLRDWTLTGAVAGAERAAWRGWEFDELEFRIPDASLDRARWTATARRGPDRFEGEGEYRNGTIVNTLKARLADATPYWPEAVAADVTIDGRFSVIDGAFRFSGRVGAGAGSYAGLSWTALLADLDLGPDGVELPAVRVQGLPFAPDLRGSGTADLSGPGARIRVSARSGADRLEVEGDFADGRFDGRFSGAAVWAGEAVRAAGRVLHEGGTLRLSLDAGEIATARHGPLELRIEDGRASFEETDVELDGLKALLRGSLRWTGGRLAAEARARRVAYRGAHLGTVVAELSRDGDKGDLELSGIWAGEEGSGAELRGRWGRTNDLRLQARVPDLSRPWVRRLFRTAPEFRGALRLDARAGGTAETPVWSGSLAVEGASVGASLPLTLDFPISGEGRRVAITLPPSATPYGRLSIDAWISPEDVEARAHLEASTLGAFARHLPEEWRCYVPEVGNFELDGSFAGGRWDLAGTLRVPKAQGPEPLGALTELAARATADGSGLRVEQLSGRMGGGPFEGKLHWLWGGPLRAELEGTELLVVATRLSNVRVSTNLVLSWAEGGRARLEGKIRIPVALLHEEPASPRSGGAGLAVGGLRLRPAAAGGVLLPGMAGMESVDLDVLVESGGELRVENSLVGALLRAEGRLRGTLAEPAASGRVEVLSGEVKLPAAIFVRIEEARVSIPPEPKGEPDVRFVGRVGRGDGSIEIRVQGPLARPDLLLRSDPPRPQEELLARLAFGHAPGAVSESAALGTLAVRLFEQYAAGWPQAEPKDDLFSRLRPTIVGAEEADPRRAPWQLPTGRGPRSMAVRTEYLWTPHFSVVAEADREANVGGDIKLRLRFR